MFAALIYFSIAAAAIAAVVSGYILASLDEEIKSKTAVEIVDNARFLQQMSAFNSSNNRAYLIDSYQVPFSALIVKDGDISEQYVNTLSKQYEAVRVLLENDPNFSDVSDCTLMASTKKISEAECELVKDKQFRVYSLNNGSVSFDVSNDERILTHVKTIQGNFTQEESGSVAFVEGETETAFALGSASSQNTKSLRREHKREEKILKDIDSLLSSGDFVGAAAAANKLAITSTNFGLVKSQLDKVAIDVLAAPVVSADEIARSKIAKAYIAKGTVSVLERAGIEVSLTSSYLAEQVSLSTLVASADVLGGTNSYIGIELGEKVVTYFSW